MAALTMDAPNLPELLKLLSLDLLWHPSLSSGSPTAYAALLDAMERGEQPLDVLCVEGNIIRGPGGTGRYDTFGGRPKKDLIAALAKRAGVVVAVGTCAAYGGVCGSDLTEATGLQFHRRAVGGFLGADWRSRRDLPVINLSGCPCQPDVVGGTLAALCSGVALELDAYNRPLTWYGTLVHQGCVRNEYHEYRVEERDFGERGCLFFHMGCRGPLAHGPCNKTLWNRRNSKTRAGVPCVGCTEPDFPSSRAFFETNAIIDVPLELPDGVDRAHYLAYKSMAAAAAPERLRRRETNV